MQSKFLIMACKVLPWYCPWYGPCIKCFLHPLPLGWSLVRCCHLKSLHLPFFPPGMFFPRAFTQFLRSVMHVLAWMSSLAEGSHGLRIPTSLLNLSLICVIVSKTLIIDNTHFSFKDSFLHPCSTRLQTRQKHASSYFLWNLHAWSIKKTWWVSGPMAYRGAFKQKHKDFFLENPSLLTLVGQEYREQEIKEEGLWGRAVSGRGSLKGHKNQEPTALAPASL